jgi:O-antigen/teichoic acid export membrane protein
MALNMRAITLHPLLKLRGLTGVIARKGGWAIADQAIASIGNFGRNIILARFLLKEVFGEYGMILSAFLFLNSLQAALVIYPVQVKGSVIEPQRLAGFATVCLALTLLLCLPLAAVMGVSAWFVTHHSETAIANTAGLWTALTVAVALVTFQCQELFRRTLMARLRFGAAVPGDALCYLGQLAVIWWVGHAGWLQGPMALPRAFAVMSIMTALAAVVQALQVGLAPINRGQVREFIVSFWQLGKWLLAANLTMIVTDIGYNWVLGLVHQAELAAYYRVIADLNKLSNPVVFTLVGLIVPVVARTLAGSDVRYAKRVGLKYAAVGFVPFGLYFLILLAVPELLLRLLYDEAYWGLANGVRLFALTSITGFVATMALAVLNGLGRPRAQFNTQLTNTLATLLVGLPLTYYFDLYGALWGGLVATLALTAVAVVTFIRTR